MCHFCHWHPFIPHLIRVLSVSYLTPSLDPLWFSCPSPQPLNPGMENTHCSKVTFPWSKQLVMWWDGDPMRLLRLPGKTLTVYYCRWQDVELLSPSYFRERGSLWACGQTGRESRDGEGQKDDNVIEYLDETAHLDSQLCELWQWMTCPHIASFPGHTRKVHFSASPCRQVGLLDWTLAKGICTKVMLVTFKLLPKNILWDTLVLFSSSIAPMRCSRRYEIECCGEYWVGTEAADNVREDSVGKTFEQRPASPSKQTSKQWSY